MFFLSLLFSQSIVSPIKILSKILRSERNKSNKKNNKFTYPELPKNIDAGGKLNIQNAIKETIDMLIIKSIGKETI